MGGGERGGVGEGWCGGSSADKDQISFDNNLNPIWRHTGTIEPGGKSSDNKDEGVYKEMASAVGSFVLLRSPRH